MRENKYIWRRSNKEWRTIKEALMYAITGLSIDKGKKLIYDRFTKEYEHKVDTEKCFYEYIKGIPFNIPLYETDEGMHQLQQLYASYPMSTVRENSIKYTSYFLWNLIKDKFSNRRI